MDLSIIIVNYCSKEKLINCLNSISLADLSGLVYEVVVVENNSGDDLSDLNYPFLKIITSDTNLGMGKGNNLGIARSTGEYILVANPDVVFSPSVIKKLYEYLRTHPEAGLVAPKLLNPDGSLQYSCVRFPKFYTPLLRRTAVGQLFPGRVDHYLMKNADHSQIQSVDWILGACFLVRRHEIKDQRLFDERYFMYFEDVDLCREIKTRGQQVIYLPEAQITHDHLRQSAREPWYKSLIKDKIAREHLKSAFRYFKKWKKVKA